jgi:pimeloyl-ACP methyl ester carboxylesterase
MKGYVDTRWGQLHYSERGRSDQTIVLLHETPLNHQAFERLAPALADTFRTIAFDTPGYGESDPPPAVTTIEEYSTTFVEAMDALGLDRVTLFGVHTGASYAVEIAAKHPDRVDAVILCGIPFYDEDVRQAKVAPAAPEFLDDGSHLVSGFLRPPKEYDNQMLSRMVGSQAERPDRVWWAYEAVYAYRPDLAFPNVKAPTLFISNRVDVLRPSDDKALHLIPGAQQTFIGGEELPLYWTCADELANQIKQFVATSSA